jgi:formylglycine-generating enzyme required for sulfatase activity
MPRSFLRSILVPVLCCLALTAGALLLQAQISLSDLWIRFPDGTVQTTAAGNCVNPADLDDEMIRVGGVCIDKYEASIWDAPVGGNQITGAIPCSPNGQDCDNIWARSVAGVLPRASITWFQAQAALANSGKRLPTNAEWQMAVLGTQDPGGTPGAEDCNTMSSGPEWTGERASCVSRWGHHDMVGNVSEWVADWDEVAAGCEFWPPTFGGDRTCIGRMDGDAGNHIPGALVRGGDWSDGSGAGPFAVFSFSQPSGADQLIGFRGAR